MKALKSTALFVISIFVMGALFYSQPHQAFAEEIRVSSFEELKLAIQQAPASQELSIILEESLDMAEPLIIDGDKNIKLRASKALSLKLGFFNSDAAKLGDAMFKLAKGSKLSISQSEDDPLITFDGMQSKTQVSGRGSLLHVEGEVIINNAAFINSQVAGLAQAPLYVNGGKLTINQAQINNNTSIYTETIANKSYDFVRNWNQGYSAAPAIGVSAGGSLLINNAEIKDNNIVSSILDNRDFKMPIPGAISVNTGSVEIKGGHFSNNKGMYGGVLQLAYGARGTISGGSFESNYGREAGGAIFQDFGTQLSINGGEFKNNNSRLGGAIANADRYRSSAGEDGGSRLSNLAQANNITQISTWERNFAAPLTINDGSFKNNNAQLAGGALYISSNNAKINKADFEQNTALRFGGAIYLSSVPYKLYIKNAFFDQNKALEQDVDLNWNYYGQSVAMPKGSGGALWYCPTGNTELYVSNSAGFGPNSAVHDGDELSSVKKSHAVDSKINPDKDSNKDFSITVSDRMLGGTKINWYTDGSSNPDQAAERYKEGDKALETLPRESQDAVSLKAISASTDGIDLARSLSTVNFINNSAARGGAIATNGTVVLGEDRGFNLKVVKQWAQGTTPQEVIIELLNITDPQRSYVLQEIKLNKDNNFEYLVEHLPIEAGNKAISYGLREKGNAFISTVEASGPGAEGDKISTETMRELAPTEVSQLTMTNKPKPEDPKPEEPEKPTPPDPTQPEKPGEPDKPADPTPPSPAEPTKPGIPPLERAQKIGALPKTGQSSYAMLASGLTLMGCISLIAARRAYRS